MDVVKQIKEILRHEDTTEQLRHFVRMYYKLQLYKVDKETERVIVDQIKDELAKKLEVCKFLSQHPTTHEWICTRLKESFEVGEPCVDIDIEECDIYTPIPIEKHPDAEILKEIF